MLETVITGTDILLYLAITASILVIVVLYHLLFIVVDLRKTMRRIESLTKQVEGVVMKPINIIEHVLDAAMEFIETKQKKAEKPSKK